ncbi:hypothetical protein ES703_25830 [subsurface metagenome]
MPKQFTAQKVTNFNPMSFVFDGDDMIGFEVSVEVNYGSFGLTHQLNIWPMLNDAQKSMLFQLQTRLKVALDQYYLG